MRDADRILVTGGAGFIGANFVRLLLAETAMTVVVADALTYAGNLASLAEVRDHPRFVFRRVDIRDRAALRGLCCEHRPQWIVNLAAESHVDRSIDGPRAFLDTNVRGTFELLEVARSYWVEGDTSLRGRFRFLQVSTDEVYGSRREPGGFSESSPYAPCSPYAASKAAADHFVSAYHATYGLPTLLTHSSNNFGPFQHPEKLIPLMVLNAIEGRSLPIYGDGAQVRDWLHVTDHGDALLTILRRGEAGARYNVASGRERPNREVVDRICAILERQLPAAQNEHLRAARVEDYRALERFVADRPGHDRRYAVDASRLRRELGWRPRRPLEDALAETVAWYLAHSHWCEEVQRRGYRRERLGLGGSE